MCKYIILKWQKQKSMFPGVTCALGITPCPAGFLSHYLRRTGSGALLPRHTIQPLPTPRTLLHVVASRLIFVEETHFNDLALRWTLLNSELGNKSR